jgi:simple sugar transport system ATP-binding protein
MLLRMEGITKVYGGVTANAGVDFTLREGEVHALVGENGAGKTTLMRILYGEEQPTSGTIRIRGRGVSFRSPDDAIRAGIGMVHQHFMLFPSFTVAENIVIGREPVKGVLFDRRKAEEEVRRLSAEYGMPVDPRRRVADCPVGIQQRVEILKVLYRGADIIILDEPSAVLTPLEVRELLGVIRGLADRGKSVILITHKLHEVMDAADRITVLRDGKVTGTFAAADTNAEELSRLMVGRELVPLDKRPASPGEAVLEVRDLTIRGGRGKARPVLDRVSFTVRAGEIVGVAGVSGNGQTELVQAIAGLRAVDGGAILLAGHDITGATARRIRETGLAHIPEDRYAWGAAVGESVADNAAMGHTARFGRGGVLLRGRIRRVVEGWVDGYGIRAGSLEAKACHLSGGNLQKLIVARELAHGTPLVIAAEPTRGVDVGAMETIHRELVRRRDEGGAVLLVSSELTEILKLSDRILVMYEGRIVGELRTEEATEESISLLMTGGTRHAAGGV